MHGVPARHAGPNPRTSHLQLADYHPHEPPSELALGDDGRDFAHAAVRCVGIGKCRKRDSGTMCPSYMVTLDERHSTRGRAHLLFEMMRGDVITDGWRSEEVRDALDLCLACKACKNECPTHAEFMAHHYAHRVRPRDAYAFGRIDRWLALARPIAQLANAMAPVVKRFAGIAAEREVPQIAARSFRDAFVRPTAARGATALWPDTFNDAFYPEILHAAVEVLEATGFAVDIPRRRLCCARPQLEYGWLDDAPAHWRRTIATLADDIDAGTPIVGIEPSCTSAFRDELLALLPGSERAERLARSVVSIGELLADRATPAREPQRMRPGRSFRRAARRILYHRHCHQAAVLAPERDIALLEHAGHDVRVLDSGCCGMAGAFGFLRDQYELSVALAGRAVVGAAA